MPIKIIDKVSASYLAREWPKYQDFISKTSSLNFDDEFKKALFASSDEEALNLLHSVQEKYKAAGVDEMAEFVAQKAAERDDVGF